MYRIVGTDSKEHTLVVCRDRIGLDGMCHEYEVIENQDIEPLGAISYAKVSFQNGSVNEVKVNGCYNEDLIVIVIDRLRHLQESPCACEENAIALAKLEASLLWLRERGA